MVLVVVEPAAFQELVWVEHGLDDVGVTTLPPKLGNLENNYSIMRCHLDFLCFEIFLHILENTPVSPHVSAKLDLVLAMRMNGAP